MIRLDYILFILIYFNGGTLCFAQVDDDILNWNGEFNKIIQSQQKNPERLPVHIDKLRKLVSNYEINQLNLDSSYIIMNNRLSDWYFKSGDYDSGLKLLNSLVAICKNESSPFIDHSYLASVYYNLAYYYEMMNLSEPFHLYMDSSIQVSQKFPNLFTNAIKAYERLSLHHINKGDHHQSMHYVEKGLLYAGNREGDGHVILLYLQKIQALLLENSIDKARENLEIVFDILSRSSKSEEYWGLVYSTIAYLMEMEGDFEQAISYYQKAFNYSSKKLNYLDSYKALNNMGNLYNIELKQAQKALNCYQESIEYLHLLGDHIGLATVYNNMGNLYLKQSNYKDAIESFHNGFKALSSDFSDTLWFKNPTSEHLRSVGHEQITFSLNYNKAETFLKYYLDEGNQDYLEVALETFKLADLSINLMRWNQRHDESKLYWREESKEMYELAIETCFQLQDTESALYFFEKSRAVLLNDKLSELGANQYLSKEDAKKEQELKLEMVSLQRKLSGASHTSTINKNVANKRFQIQEEYEAFIRSLEAKYPDYYQYKYDTTVVSSKDMMDQVLEPDQAYLGYFVGKEYVYALTIENDSAKLHKMPLEQFPARAKELLSLTSDQGKLNQDYPRYLELAHGFYKSFFQPLGIKNKRILISPDDYFISLELLIKDIENPGSFLLNDHAFSYTYSAGILLKNKKRNSRQTASLLGIAPVDYQPYLQMTPLMGSDRSLNRLKENFSSSQLYIGGQATKKQFLNQLSQNDIVQLYSHATADDNGTEPTLYFADSLMLLSELKMLGNLDTQLIILSACNTAVGKNVPGEGVFSLARGFAAAGIPSSITSLWAIDNHATFRLSEKFYEILAQNKPTDIALQEAKLLFLQENPGRYQLPYFWADKVLVGKTFTFNLRNHYWAYLGVIIFAILLIEVLVYHQKKKEIPF